MTPTPVTRVDLHCHSAASQESRLGAQRALGLPECATPPEEVYELAKRRGMDFVTIADHDTIAGVLEIADRPDVFVSEELTARFRGEPQTVHVLCFGITPEDHDWLQAHSDDLERCAEYLHGNGIACAPAHPYYSVAAPLTPAHRRRLAGLFPIWETRNGARAPELNQPAAAYCETHGRGGVGGSDDHAGVDVGRTWTETALAVRVLERDDDAAPAPQAVLALMQRIVCDGSARSAAIGADLSARDARAVLRAWLASLELDIGTSELLERLQADDFSHAALFRRARTVHERKLRAAVSSATASGAGGDLAGAAGAVFDACVPAVPYAPAAAVLGRERRKLAPSGPRPPRVALVADGLGAVHGVARTLEELRERGVPGFDVDVVGTDASVDRRLPAVAEVEAPFYRDLRVGVPSLPAAVETLADGRYDLLHFCSPGPAGVAAALIARTMDLPLVGSYHTELGTYAGLRSGDARLRAAVDTALAVLFSHCRVVLSPSESSDESVRALGVPADRIARWDRGVDTERFDPARRDESLLPGELSVLYAGRLTTEKGVELLAEAFLAARGRDPRLHLVLAGSGPEEELLRTRLGGHATFLGWLGGLDLACVYASADVFLFASATDTFGQAVLEAQASGVPVVAVDRAGPRVLIDDRRTGRLCRPEPAALAAAICELAASPVLRQRLASAARTAARARTWEAAFERLAEGYERALFGTHADRRDPAAA